MDTWDTLLEMAYTDPIARSVVDLHRISGVSKEEALLAGLLCALRGLSAATKRCISLAETQCPPSMIIPR